MARAAASGSQPMRADEGSSLRRIAWVCLHLVAVLVPLAMTNISFLNQPALSITYDMFALPKVVVLRSLVLIGLVAWTGDLLTRGGVVRWVRAGWVAVAFFAWAALSTAFAQSFVVSLFGTYGRVEGLITIACYVLLFFLTLQLADSAKRVRSLVRTIVVTAGVVSAYGLLQAAGLDPLEWVKLGFDSRMAFSTLGNPDLLGAYLVAPLALSLGLLFSEKSVRLQVAYGCTTALIAAALAATFVRGAWLGGLAALIAFAVALLRGRVSVDRRQLLLGAGALGLVVVVAALSLMSSSVERNFLTRVTSIFQGGGSLSTRFLIWGSALRAIAARPVLGVGPDAFGLAYTPFEAAKIITITNGQQIANNAHNVFLQYAATLGVVGAVLFAMLPVLAIARSAKVAFARRGDASHLLFSGIAAGTIGYLVYLLSGLSDVGSMWLLWVALGMLLSAGASSRRVEAKSWGGALSIALGLVVVVAVVWNVSLIASDYRYLKGNQNPDPAAGVVDLDAAIRLNPFQPDYYRTLGSVHGRLMEQLLGTSGGAVTDLVRSEFQKAEDALVRATKMTPTDYAPYVSLAEFYNRASYFVDIVLAEKGREAAAAAVKYRPAGPAGLYQLALANMQLGDYESALEAALRANTLLPSYAETQLLLGQLYQKTGELERARDEYAKGLELLQPTDSRYQAAQEALASVEASLAAGAK